MINISSIIYAEAEGNYTRLFLSNGNVELITLQLHSIEEKLPESKFIRINRSNMINIDYISSYNRKTKKVIMYDILQKFEFSVSKSGNQKLMKL
jgi:two-component system LytT family response regulator